MSRSRVYAIWWWGGWPGNSAWSPPLWPARRWMRCRTGKSDAYAGYRSQYTYVYSPFTPQQGFYLEFSVHTKPRPYSPLLCQVCSQYPAQKVVGLASLTSSLSLLTSTDGCWVGVVWSERISYSAWHNRGWWCVFFAGGWAWGPFWPGRWSCHIYCCGETWQGLPSCNKVNAWYLILPYDLEFQCHIGEINHSSITGDRDMLHVVVVCSWSPVRKACQNYEVVWDRTGLLLQPGSNLGQWPIHP